MAASAVTDALNRVWTALQPLNLVLSCRTRKRDGSAFGNLRKPSVSQERKVRVWGHIPCRRAV
jgi:hypothetical protein